MLGVWQRHYDYQEWRLNNPQYSEEQAKEQYERELFNYQQYRETLVLRQKRDELFSPYKRKKQGIFITPPPPPPPPEPPSGYSLWFDAYDTSTLVFEDDKIRTWKAKTGNVNFIAPDGGIDYSDGITHENNGVKLSNFDDTRYPHMSASIIGDVSQVSYGTGSLTLFMVGEIHSKPIVNPSIPDTYYGYGRAIGVTTNEQTGSWQLHFRAGANNNNSTFRPQLAIQTGTNTFGSSIQANTAFIQTGSGIFTCEFQISKSNDDTKVRVVTSQGDRIEETTYDSLSILDEITDSNDLFDNGLDVVLHHQSVASTFNANATWYSLLHYPKLLNQDTTQEVYDYINHYYGTSFNASTGSYI